MSQLQPAYTDLPFNRSEYRSLTNLIEMLELSNWSPETAVSNLQAAQPLLEAFLTSGEVLKIINAHMNLALHGDSTALSALGPRCVLAASQSYRIVLQLLSPGEDTSEYMTRSGSGSYLLEHSNGSNDDLRFISQSSNDNIMGMAGGEELGVTLFKLPQKLVDDDTADPLSERVSFVSEQTMRPGDSILVDSKRNCVDVQLQQPAVVVVVLSMLFRVTRVWHFSKELTPIFSSAANVECDRLNRMTALLSEISSVEYIPKSVNLLQRLTKVEDAHYVRWRAIQALTLINPTKGIAALRKAVNDVHPEIRKVAEQSLARLHAAGLVQ